MGNVTVRPSTVPPGSDPDLPKDDTEVTVIEDDPMLSGTSARRK
jgi:hypothetical protein